MSGRRSPQPYASQAETDHVVDDSVSGHVGEASRHDTPLDYFAVDRSPHDAADELRAEVRAGRHDGEVVEVILGVAGHRACSDGELTIIGRSPARAATRSTP